MLTLVKTKDAVPIVGIYVGKKNKKPEETVYFTHETSKDTRTSPLQRACCTCTKTS